MCRSGRWDVKVNRTALIIGSDHDVSSLVREHLSEEGFCVKISFVEERREEAYPFIRSQQPGVVILDLASFNRIGFEACREIRELSDELMIVLLNQEDELNQTLAFELGADDVITKPVSSRLLHARLRAHLRRGDRLMNRGGAGMVSIGELTIHPGRREAYLKGQPLCLTTLLFDLLRHFMSNVGSVISREDLCRSLFNSSYNGVDRRIDVYISRLRRKIEHNPAQPEYLKTVRGEGYLFVSDR